MYLAILHKEITQSFSGAPFMTNGSYYGKASASGSRGRGRGHWVSTEAHPKTETRRAVPMCHKLESSTVH